jgi:hypothetical protein
MKNLFGITKTETQPQHTKNETFEINTLRPPPMPQSDYL